MTAEIRSLIFAEGSILDIWQASEYISSRQTFQMWETHYLSSALRSQNMIKSTEKWSIHLIHRLNFHYETLTKKGEFI